MGHNSSDDAEVNKRVEEGQASLAAYNGNGRDMGGGGFFSGQRPVSEALITALLGAGGGMQAAQGAEGPWPALIAGASGGAETAMAVEQKRREEGMRRMAMTPLGVAHPALATSIKDRLGVDVSKFSLEQFNTIMPAIRVLEERKKAEMEQTAVPADIADQLRGQAGQELTGQPMSKTQASALAQSIRLGIAGKRVVNLEEERALRHQERLMNVRQRLVDKFNADPVVGKQLVTQTSRTMVDEILATGGPIGDVSITTFMSRMSGEVGNLSQEDRKPFGGKQAMLARLRQAYEMALRGRLTDENRAFLGQLAEAMDRAANRNLDNIARVRAKQYATSNKMLNEQDILLSLRPGIGSMNPPPPAPVIHFRERTR